jgi:hypothetical protein
MVSFLLRDPSVNGIIKNALKNPCTFRREFHDVQWIGFLGQRNSDYALTVSHVTLSRLRNIFQDAMILNCISMKARFPWSAGLINLWRITFSSNQNVEQWLTLSHLVWIGGFNDMAGIAFSGLQMDEKLHIGSPVYFNQESRDPWRISLSGHQKDEQMLCQFQILIGRGSHDLWRISLSGRHIAE